LVLFVLSGGHGVCDLSGVLGRVSIGDCFIFHNELEEMKAFRGLISGIFMSFGALGLISGIYQNNAYIALCGCVLLFTSYLVYPDEKE
jgi:hypothetical protein